MKPRMRTVARTSAALAMMWALLALGVLTQANARAPQDDGKPGKDKDAPAKKDDAPAKQPVKLGLSINDPRAFQGYTLLAPMSSTKTYVIDMAGRVVQTWDSDCSPALCPLLLGNGHLLRPGSIGAEAQPFGPGPGVGGRIQEFTWEGELVWDFRFYNDKQLPHHDFTRLPNGNVFLIVWDRKVAKEMLAAGRRPELTGESHLLIDSLIEVKPTGKTTGEVVWEWHLWDHLVQDFDKTKANYGNVAEHPELVNINFGEDALAPVAKSKADQDKLKAIGYVGASPQPTGRGTRVNPDWTHFNGIAYNPELDQIVVSVHAFSEFWIIDHSTSTAEAASHKGGRSGKGGDLLYRYGNPLAYRAGTKADQKLFAQHNAHWIPKGMPGEGHILVFNNGGNRPDGSYSSVDELVLPVDSEGKYTKQGSAYGPDQPAWSYTAPKKSDFYSFFISGAQRLPNGNTLICSGANGTVFEVTPEKDIVWKYVNPVKGGMMGPGGFGAPTQPGQILTAITRDIVGLSSEQRKQVDDIQKDVDARLDKLLADEQRKQLQEKPKPGAPGGFGPGSGTGRILASSDQNRLKLTDEQKKDLAEFQKDVDGKLEKVLTEEQRKKLKGGFAFGGPPPGGGGPGPQRIGGGPGGRPQPGQLVPSFLHDALKLTDDQKKQLGAFQKDADEKIDKLLSDEQKKQFKEPQGPGGFPRPGEFMSPTVQARLKLNTDQKKAVQELQKEADDKLATLFTDDQKKQFKEMRANVGRGFGGAPGGGPPDGAPGGGPGGPPGFGPQGGSPLFRAYRFAASYPGLAGRELAPGKTIEELQKETEKK
jgi:hypothetical protein